MNIAARKQRWNRFYDAAGQSAYVYMIGFDDAPPLDRPWPNPDMKQARIEHAWTMYQRQLQRTTWLRDDMIPSLWVYTGTEIFAEAMGCAVHRPADNMPFALPFVHNAAEAERLKVPDFSATPLAMLFEMGDELRRRAGPDALFKLVDIQSPMDIVALIWDKNDLYTALIETPAAVQELAAKVHTLLVSFLDAWFARYGRDFMAHYPDYYMPYGLTLSEDEVGIVSTEMFEAFYYPELAALSDRYGALGMHCCANARHQWDGFARIPNLKLLNLVQPAPVCRDALEYFARRTAQMHAYAPEGPAWTWPAQYPAGARVVFDAPARTRDEALLLAEKLWTACHR
jgi:hypothetical protein